MKRKFAILGLGHFGLNLALHLMKRGAEVLAIDIDEERVERVRDRVSHAMILDTSDKNALKGLGLEKMDAVVVGIGENFEASILTTAHLQEMGVKKIINRVMSPVHERLLKLMKVEALLLPEGDAAFQLSRKMTMTGVLGGLELTKDYSIIEVAVPKKFIGKKLVDIDLRKNYKLNLITIIREISDGSEMLTLGDRPKLEVFGIPTTDTVFSEEDILVLFGKETDLKSFTES